MRHYIILLALTINLSCLDTSRRNDVTKHSTNSTYKKIALQDGLGYLNLAIPNRYDTFYCFGYNEGCGLGISKNMYKFQTKDLWIFEESGMINPSEPKKKDQILISQKRIELSEKFSPNNLILDYHSEFKKEVLLSPFKNGLKAEFISKSDFGSQSNFILSFDDTSRHVIRKEVIKSFFIKNNIVVIKYLYETDLPDSISNIFIEQALESAKSLQISNGY